MPYKLKDPVRHKFKKKHYNQRDWKTYERGLRSRGDFTMWISEEAVSCWTVSDKEKKTRGRQKLYTDFAIETGIRLRLIFKQALRQTEGFLCSVLQKMGLSLPVPDHTTLSRRGIVLALEHHSQDLKGKVVILDSTGLKVFGEKEWMHHKHGCTQRKVWRKLHLSISEEGTILSATLTDHTKSDTSQVPPLLKSILGPITAVIADGGYDHSATYEAIQAHSAGYSKEQTPEVVIPPNTGFWAEKGSDPPERLKNIRHSKEVGRAVWQKEKEYGRRSRVENVFHRYKSIIGNKLRARRRENQETEIQIACAIMNSMASLGIPRAQRSL